MLRILDPALHYCDAHLDENNNAIKITSDGLEISAIGLDAVTSATPILNVIFARVNIETYEKAGPNVFQIITGIDLEEILMAGLTVDSIETVILRTGITTPPIPSEQLEKVVEAEDAFSRMAKIVHEEAVKRAELLKSIEERRAR